MYQERYMKALEKNNKEMGIPFVDPKLSNFIPPVARQKIEEPHVPFLDRVYVNLKILKSGIVRVKVVPHFLMLYENYYKQGVRPSLKQIIQAHKAMGFSDSFITKIKKSEERRLAFAKKVPKILEKIFDREPVKKVKKKEKPKPVVDDLPTEEPEVEAEPEENNTSNEDCTMDVEPDQEDEEVVEDEYFSEED
tara:strand:+ start:7198 stop:7776 length:579 start_codon:yes stop_codon:yes gene_type:complete